MPKISLALTAPQEEFALSEAAHPALCGGLGSGKSEAALTRLFLLMTRDWQRIRRPVNTLLTMPTYDLLRLRAMPGLEEILSRSGFAFKTNSSEYFVHIPPFGKMYFRSYDRPERIVAFEVAHSICDELDTLPKEKASLVWRKVTERTRQKIGVPNSVGNVTTPDQGLNGFTYQKWGKNPAKGYHLIKAATTSNPYLPDDYVDQIRANYDPILAELYINGEFVSLTANKVYHFFDRNKHHTSRTIKDGEKLHIGLDFNVGGCCAVVFAVEDNNPVAVAEFVSHDTQDFINGLAKYKGHKITIYPDASGRSRATNASRSDVDMIEQDGYMVDAPAGNPAVRDRINAVNGLLSHDRLKVNTDACPLFTEALETQGYDKKGDPEKWDDHPAIDDWVDAGGYMIHRRWPISKPIAWTGIGTVV